MTRETEVGREGKVLSDKQLNRLVMESGKSPSKGFQNRLDQCHLVLGKKILLGTRACSRWHPEIPSSPISFLCFYDSKSIFPFYGEKIWMLLHFSLFPPPVGR